MPNNKKAVLVRQPAVFNKIGSCTSQSALSKAGLTQDIMSSSGLPDVQSGSIAMNTACRQALIHLLGIKPLEVAEIVRTTHIPKDTCMHVLQKIANSDQSSMKWKLTDKAFKELNPYVFQYESEDRTAAIECAVAAFDRQRISKDDKIWQKLLPLSERGSGKTLSKLNLTGPGSSTPNVPRPSTKSSSPANESVSGILSADESRPQAKFGAAAEVRAKQIFNRKTIPKPSSSSSSSSRPNKTTTSDSNAATAAVSDNDMAKKGVAQRVLKRKISDAKFKSDERIDNSAVEDDDLVVKAPSYEPDRKKLKMDTEGTKTTRIVPASSDAPAKKKEMTKQINKPQTSTPTMKPKVTTTTATPSTATASTVKKTSALDSSANAIFRTTASPPKPRKVARATGSVSDGEKQKPVNISSTVQGHGASRQQHHQTSPGQQQQKNSSTDDKLKPKQIAATTVKGLLPSPNLPPKPPRSVSSSNITSKTNNKPQTSSTKSGQVVHSRTNEGSAASAHAGKQTQKQTTTDNAQLHKRIPSTSTTSSSSVRSAIFTPPTHRNSTSSSLSSSSSMVFTRADAKALKRDRDDSVKIDGPATKKVKKVEVEVTKRAEYPNSSPLTATSELASVSTPAQSAVAARSPLPPPPAASKAKAETITAIQTHPQTENVNVPIPTAEQLRTVEINAKRRRLASLRTQFYQLFRNWISARVAFHKDESNATPKTHDSLKAHHTKVKAMEVEIRSLMDDVDDFTMWDGVPAKFTTEHEDFLRERLRTLHPIYNEKWDTLEKMRATEDRGEKYDVLKKDVCKRLEEIEDLQAILHPAQEWEFVADVAGVESSQ